MVMDIWPAIDLMSGSCVRLIQGQYHKKISYEIDPAKQAKKFYDAGARFIHVVDLDGAKVGKPINIEAIKSIVATAGVKVEVGGGIRDEEDIQTMLDIGVERVILGTNAASKFEWFSEMANKFPGKLVLGIDARGSKVAIKGWTEEDPSHLLDFAEKCLIMMWSPPAA
jgi:phosphoribosylformimino-5-aminoimidazole carboxamide ribotide isomerase